MSELPKGWTLAPLGALASFTNGKAFKKGEWLEAGKPIIRIQNLKSPDATFNYADDSHEEKYLVRNGDLLVSWSASLGVYYWHGQDAWLNQHIFRVHDVQACCKRFLKYALEMSIDDFYAKAHGMGMVHITKGNFDNHLVPLPPLAEQTRIALKLDELLSQVDTLKARIDAIPALLKRFRQSVLAAAVSGQLTANWRELNPEVCAISIDQVKKAWTDVYRLSGRRFKEVDFIPNELGYLLPTSWVETKMGEVCDIYVGATPGRGNTKFWGGTIPWVSSSEVAFCRIKETKELITETGYKSTSTTVHPQGTVMLAMIGQGKTRGQPAILDIEACHNQNTAALRVHSNYCISEYIYYFLYERYEDTRRVGSGNNQQALNKKIVQSLPLALPPLAEQTEIVRRVEQLFAFADQLKAKVASAKKRIDHLTQSILAKAFRGELVPQDPNDEPASVLLERIKAQRAAAPKAKRGRKVSG
ncbi:restriction endonuclease subunit S [Pseudomonas sp. CCC3.1]|uniref:restriction endonuclease subunit S n=1 Tax=Pseudomonas sp. CCC3.1 TaxID=3048607 RepID=UPI002AC91F73|nr:restriction endonuclease subunit S [Pseudomonas sp. CCC3.1]MEB0205502.1 restriction endonuclease subunit S [Pseudomonas sp. CCC3.1]WPX35319.1 restriction endonuclease subunit S [Pseudomonas sp. CCC3.1]